MLVRTVLIVGSVVVLVLSVFTVIERAPPAQVSADPVAQDADDAPLGEGYYGYVRFDTETGPFADRDLPAVYLEKAHSTVACFSGRVDGKTRHVVIEKDGTEVAVSDPETLNGWILSQCADAMKFGSRVLTRREYLKTRLALLPDTPEFAAEREALAKQIGGT